MTVPRKHAFDEIRLSLFPTCAVVVTAINNKNEVGATTIAWTGIVSTRPPLITVSFLPDSFTRACIMETREFVVNVPSNLYKEQTNFFGSISGPFKKKIELMEASGIPGVTLGASSTIRAPYIEEFYLNFECRTLNVIQFGLYDCFIGIVQKMHCSNDVFLDDHPRGNVRHANAQPILCLGDQYWSAGNFLGYTTENKNHPHGDKH